MNTIPIPMAIDTIIVRIHIGQKTMTINGAMFRDMNDHLTSRKTAQYNMAPMIKYPIECNNAVIMRTPLHFQLLQE